MLMMVEDWALVCAREVPDRAGAPIVGIDLGHSRSWSAAVAIWRTGRVEALAVAPGIPSLEAQEKRDRASWGAYRKLALAGTLRIAEGLRVPTPAQLYEAACAAFGQPARIVCDRFKLDVLRDAVGAGVPIVDRVTRWSSATEDIQALRKIALDGPLSVEAGSRDLLTASLGAAMVKTDDQGSVRLAKKGTNNTARDDVAAALTLAAGSFVREPPVARRRLRSMIAG